MVIVTWFYRKNQFFGLLRLRKECVGCRTWINSFPNVQTAGFQNMYRFWWSEVVFWSKSIGQSFERFSALENSREFFWKFWFDILKKWCEIYMHAKFQVFWKNFSLLPHLGLTSNNTVFLHFSYPLKKCDFGQKGYEFGFPTF